MHTALWIIQIILGVKLLSVAYTHGVRQSQPPMQESMQRMGRLAQPLHSMIAFLALIGALGLTLPGVLEISARVISITAMLLSLLLLASMILHIRTREKPKVFVSLILFALAAFVAYGRWGFLHG